LRIAPGEILLFEEMQFCEERFSHGKTLSLDESLKIKNLAHPKAGHV
jgi:hypothetical protein